MRERRAQREIKREKKDNSKNRGKNEKWHINKETEKRGSRNKLREK